METMVVGVGGMSCGGCVKNVTGVLEALPGVASVEVSLDAGQAKIAYDPAQVGRPQFVAAIENAGFDVA
ncbi:MAG: cation transporter [Propionivibrio sp.]